MKEFFEKFTDIIKNYERVIIMTHSTPDLDGMGSSIVYYKILKKLGKECVIVAPKHLIDSSLNKVINYVNEEETIPFMFEKNIVTDNSLLVVFDTQEAELTECPDLLLKVKDKVVIDHHSKGLTLIGENICEYLDDSKSSTIEIVAEYLKFLDIKLDSLYYTIMLAGLAIDTNNFNFKTTSRTFEIASYLLDCGANLELKQQFLKESMEKFLNRYSYIEESVILADGVCLAVIDDRYTSSVEVAKLASEILKFEKIKLAIAVGKDHNEVLVSSRSIGDIDVSKFMMKLGGGGHKNAAACKIHNGNMDDVIDEIKTIIKEGLCE